jgi:hypothetical protein
MAKSRRNVSRRKRQQKKRKSSHRNFKGKSTPEIISQTIERLKEKNSWVEFVKDYDFGKFYNHFQVKRIIEEEQKKKQAAPAAKAAEAAPAPAENQGYVNWREKIVRTPEEDEWIRGPNMRHK